MTLKFLGTGTSQGVPPIGCTHPVCLSRDPRDRRLRTSAIITTDSGKKILIDCGPDFRQQMLANRESRVDAVLITHEHNDHVIGLDDLRPLIFHNGAGMPLYCRERVGNEIRARFPYAFAKEKYPGAPTFDLHAVDGEFEVCGEKILPVTVRHRAIDIYGYRLKDLAYITDASFISEEEKRKLRNLEILIVNCLRKTEPHPAHFILPDVLKLVEELRPRQTFLTHISHHLGFHSELIKILPAGILPAYDGQEIKF